MRTILHYIRQCFCKHQLIFEEKNISYSNEYRNVKGIKVYMRCTKCGFHKNHWKYL